jgi:hypothetical protein
MTILPLRSLHEIRLPYHKREQRNFLADTLTDTTRTKRLYMPTYALEPTNLPTHPPTATMPPHNNTLQTILPEIRNQIYDKVAQNSTRVILGRKFLASHALGEHDGILPVQFASAATLEPISMTCRQLYMESATLLATTPDPPAYHFVVNNFNLDQVDLFRAIMDCPTHCKRESALRFQFDSGVLESALELERRVALKNDEWVRECGGLESVFRCKVQDFMLVFALNRDTKVFGGEGDAGGTGRAMTESQARETVQVLRRIRKSGGACVGDHIIMSLCDRFEHLLDVHVWRSKGTSDVWTSRFES